MMCMDGFSSKIDLCTNLSYFDQIRTFASRFNSTGRWIVPFYSITM